MVHIGGFHVTSWWPCWWSRTNKTIPLRWEVNFIFVGSFWKKSLDWPATSPSCHVLVKRRIWFISCKISDEDRGVSLKWVDTLAYISLVQIWCNSAILVTHMKLLVNKRSPIFPVTTPTVDIGQNIRKNCSFSFRYLFVWRFMTSYLRNSKITPLTHILSFVLLSIAEKNPRTLAITFGKLSVFQKAQKE